MSNGERMFRRKHTPGSTKATFRKENAGRPDGWRVLAAKLGERRAKAQQKAKAGK